VQPRNALKEAEVPASSRRKIIDSYKAEIDLLRDEPNLCAHSNDGAESDGKSPRWPPEHTEMRRRDSLYGSSIAVIPIR
jgi:hypothetical protein